MARVFAPQLPSRYDSSIQCWVPTVNLDPAKVFGDIEILLPPEASRMPVEDLYSILEPMLSDITKNDWLLAVGDPVVMSIVVAIATDKLDGLLRVLRWDKRTRHYESIELQL